MLFPLIATVACALAGVLPALTSLQGPPQGLRFTPPSDWIVRQPSSTMRVAEFGLPKAGRDQEDGELVVYFFGGSGGGVEANIERWIGQMQQPDGRPSRDLARRTERTVNGLSVTLLDISGTYTAEVRPGSSERHNKPGFRMRTAVVNTPRGPYFVKAVGPANTMERWATAFDAFIGSFAFSNSQLPTPNVSTPQSSIAKRAIEPFSPTAHAVRDCGAKPIA